MLDDDITTEAQDRQSNSTLMYEIVDNGNTANPSQDLSSQITLSPEERYRTEEALFYNTYDPNLGYTLRQSSGVYYCLYLCTYFIGQKFANL